ncbi:MAG: bifunctional hydroxymethylpyrimidine kinase/phosphomethylpyrimidine kinase [Alphaproteobacteria bacterium]
MSEKDFPVPNVLSIAGSDPSGGAGVQADLKTFSALGCYGMAALTALTVQNTQGVRDVHDVPAAFVRAQIEAIFEDIEVGAVKIGMLAHVDVIEQVAGALETYKPPFIVLDPVMVATSGDPLISSEAIEVLRDRLVPLADVITPNIPEAQKLSRRAVLDMEEAAQGLLALGSRAVFLKGGHLKGDEVRDVFVSRDGGCDVFSAPRVDTANTHGTGCTLSSAIAAYLAKGVSLPEACRKAKTFLTGALQHADNLDVGCGHGPVHHGYKCTC